MHIGRNHPFSRGPAALHFLPTAASQQKLKIFYEISHFSLII